MGGLVAHAVMDVQNGVAAQPRRTARHRRPEAGTGQGRCPLKFSASEPSHSTDRAQGVTS